MFKLIQLSSLLFDIYITCKVILFFILIVETHCHLNILFLFCNGSFNQVEKFYKVIYVEKFLQGCLEYFYLLFFIMLKYKTAIILILYPHVHKLQYLHLHISQTVIIFIECT